MEEIELIREIQAGDMYRFEELFEKYKNRAVRTAYLITSNYFTSEDIVQEAFVQAFLKINDLKNPAYFKPWFYKILTRIAWSYSKKDKKVTPIEDIFEKCDNESINKSVDNYLENEKFDFLYAQINKLEPKLKTTVILFYFNELTVKEIAKTMGCFEGTVKSRLYTVRKKLKMSLGWEGVNDEICRQY